MSGQPFNTISSVATIGHNGGPALEPTANLQSRMTIKQAAKLMNVSERGVYMAIELLGTDRDDLITAVKRGEIKLHAALVVAKPERYGKAKNGLSALTRAWRSATEGERVTFLRQVEGVA